MSPAAFSLLPLDRTSPVGSSNRACLDFTDGGGDILRRELCRDLQYAADHFFPCKLLHNSLHVMYLDGGGITAPHGHAVALTWLSPKKLALYSAPSPRAPQMRETPNSALLPCITSEPRSRHRANVFAVSLIPADAKVVLRPCKWPLCGLAQDKSHVQI